MTCEEVIKTLKRRANPKNVVGMARFGISAKNTLGIPVPFLRALAKKIGRNHILAQQLWDSGIHEARILASMIDEPSKVTEQQMKKWISGFDSWDVCDQTCMNLFDKTPFAFKKAVEYAKKNRPSSASAFANASAFGRRSRLRPTKSAGKKATDGQGEFEKRTGFALMACLAWHDKKAGDKEFIKFFPLIKKASTDERNFVRKAVNWALRQIGKRNKNLNKLAIKTAKEILKINDKTSQWIAKDALKELQDPKIQKRLKN